MISSYLNQSLEWKVKGAVNEYNEATYTTTTIRGRKETGFNLIRDAQGQELISSSFVATESAISPGDLIDGLQVITSVPMPGLDGKTEHYEVYLK